MYSIRSENVFKNYFVSMQKKENMRHWDGGPFKIKKKKSAVERCRIDGNNC